MRFGILGTANIGRIAVLPAIRATDHEALAVASRDEERARAFADECDVPRAYGSYEALLADDDIEAVYNPLPNARHAEWTKRAADAGCHVLCEKPLTVDAAEARDLGAYCDERGVTLMEAFMYRYHPRTERAVEVVREQLDDVRFVKSSFQFPLGHDAEDVRLDPDLAGGSLMDVGCYAVTAARLFLGEPERAYASAADTRDAGVDTQLTGLLEYSDGATAEVSCSFDTQDTQFYRVEAENGWLEADPAFVPRDDDRATLRYAADGREVTETFDHVDQYRRQIEHFADCVRHDRRPRTDAREAERTMAVIDALAESAERGEPIELTE
ncbi:Gfo/Idh/MocA family protein [Halococcus saccharolyticus]|uniref:Oxidoreductase domain-containing protein n=1 Tax=Halococcus saccharolyticus DSM 5350 TaxID=1227455 RepID=M0MHB5_9EURY|nr:Gfo/Idh/MocA family oxidoreductase [Halococcus saccharolyticus]EMA44074.1 oxidoreductase domain-containing protein [Halococcus saccharolyticus DSM 5350]